MSAATLDAAEATATLSDDQAARYHADGVLVVRGVFSADEVEGLLAGWREIKAMLSREGSGLTRTDRFVSGQLPPPVGDAYRHPRLVAIARRLLGEDVALYMNRLLLKDAGWSGKVYPHQDMVYFHGGLTKLAVFVPLAPMSDETGGLRFVAGSHRFGNLGVRGVVQLERFPPMPVIAPRLAVGDVCLMNFLVWHDSEASRVAADRPVVQIAYQPADDGSYFGNGVPEPTLVSGRWRTEWFVPHGAGVKPD